MPSSVSSARRWSLSFSGSPSPPPTAKGTWRHGSKGTMTAYFAVLQVRPSSDSVG
ncbi:hypothetical protein AB9Q10_23495 [Streptomyces krungchingensis]|uniref:hypothetical protein n=1 Tax=Streptomyces krungchingensis TaxID=1565034 RepID=UPI003CF10277